MKNLIELLGAPIVDANTQATIIEKRALTAAELKQIEEIEAAASRSLSAITTGVKVLGNMLSSDATNEDFGIHQDDLHGLGWLLNEMGQLMEGAYDLSKGAESFLKAPDSGDQREGGQ